MKEKSSFATALSYSSDNAAPVIAAAGENDLAEKIISIAKRYGVPVVKRPELARALVELDEDAEVPPSFFQAIAIIFNELESSARNITHWMDRGASAPRQ